MRKLRINPERERGEREREERFDEHDELFMGLMGIQKASRQL